MWDLCRPCLMLSQLRTVAILERAQRPHKRHIHIQSHNLGQRVAVLVKLARQRITTYHMELLIFVAYHLNQLSSSLSSSTIFAAGISSSPSRAASSAAAFAAVGAVGGTTGAPLLDEPPASHPRKDAHGGSMTPPSNASTDMYANHTLTLVALAWTQTHRHRREESRNCRRNCRSRTRRAGRQAH